MDPRLHVRGGAQYFKLNVFTSERRRREAMLGGGRGWGPVAYAPPENVLKKLCNLVPWTVCLLCMCKPSLEKSNVGLDAYFYPTSSRLFAGCVCVNPRLKRATWDQMSLFLSNKPQTVCWLCMCKPTLEKSNVGPDVSIFIQ